MPLEKEYVLTRFGWIKVRNDKPVFIPRYEVGEQHRTEQGLEQSGRADEIWEDRLGGKKDYGRNRKREIVSVVFTPSGGKGSFGPASHVKHIDPNTGEIKAVTLLNNRGKPIRKVTTGKYGNTQTHVV